MKIGVLDDEKVWREKIILSISNYLKKNDITDWEIASFSRGEDILEYNEKMEIVFFDVELADGLNGFSVAEKYAIKDEKAVICFLTSHTEFAREGYKINAFRYIDKICLDLELEEALTAFFSKRKKEYSIDCKNSRGQKSVIDVQFICYIETFGRKLCLHTESGERFFCDGSVRELVEDLRPYGFVQIQRSYIINMQFVDTYDSRNVRMKDGSVISFGRAKIQSFRKEYFNWRRNCLD